MRSMKAVFKLLVLASPGFLIACGGSDSNNMSLLNDFNVDFQSFNYANNGVSIEVEYGVEPFAQEVILSGGSMYGTVTYTSLPIQYEGTALPSYKVEVSLKDVNTDTVLDKQALNVSSSSEGKLVFAVGDLNNTTDGPARLIIADKPDYESDDSNVALYVMNLRDTSFSASTYSIKVNGEEVYRDLAQGVLAPLIEMKETADVLITVTDDNASKNCDITNFDWSVHGKWIVVFDKASSGLCYTINID